ncbi:MAG: glycosyltransferase family 2 protein [Acidimicrobiales bacterium]
MTNTVSVVICAHAIDRLDDIRRAVGSVAAQSKPPDELLLVIDNNERLRDLVADLPAKVVVNEGPKGLSGARNTGTRLAIGDIVAYLDDDAVADVDWLATMSAPFAKPNVMAVGGRAEPDWDEARPSWFPPEFDWVIGCSHRGLPKTSGNVRNVIGCTMAFRRSAVLAAGGFDDRLGRTAKRPSGCEETELCIRLTQRDKSAAIIYEPAARIRHRVPVARARFGYFLRRCSAEGASKAHVARLVGAEDGLASERAYVVETLPRAITMSLRSLHRAPIANLGLILAIVAGLLATGGGYLRNSLQHRV